MGLSIVAYGTQPLMLAHKRRVTPVPLEYKVLAMTEWPLAQTRVGKALTMHLLCAPINVIS
jgi:hypothetical protein